MRLLGLALVACLANSLDAQVPALGVGSPEAYQALAGAQQRATDANIAWQQSKKLGYSLPPASPHRDSECLSPSRLSNGQVGFLDCWQFETLQVIDDQNMILTHPSQGLLWLDQYPTADSVDGEKVRIIGPVRVIGTKTYKTARGSQKTVRAIRFLTRDEIAAMEKAQQDQQAAEEAAIKAAEEDKLFRTWTDDSGKYRFEAKFVGIKGGVLTLQARDGTTRDVKLLRISDDDRKWLREEMKTRREPKQSK